MEKRRLSSRELIFIGTMLFGLFFGAGNLIFPVFMGQEAGSHMWLAALGFIISGVGLPLLGVVAIGNSRSEGVFHLAKKVSPLYGYIFTMMLYLSVGPAFATPRLATISYEVGLSPFISKSDQPWALAGYTVIFFGIAWWLSRRPGKIMTYVGKILTPIFLLFLGVLLLMVLFKPLGHSGAARGAYVAQPLLTGFTSGYMTMDALAALAFGVVIVDAIKRLGVTQPGQIAKETMKSGVFAVGIMAVIYALLALLGRNALGAFPRADNGGVILANVAHAYFGPLGNLLLAGIVILACLKTGVGLITAFGDTFKELFPKLPYQGLILLASVLPMIVANVGLDQLLQISTPVLFFIYPLAITLIILGLGIPLWGESKWLFGTVTLFTVIPAILDGLKAMPAAWQGTTVQHLVSMGQVLPGFAEGLGWVVPAIVGFIVGFVLSRSVGSSHTSN